MITSTIDTQFGPVTAIVDDDGAVLASGWTADLYQMLPQIHSRLRPTTQVHVLRDLGAVTRAVQAYHAGDLHAIDDVPVRQLSNGEFFSSAWKALREVSPGHPAANRAAAQACARNAAALFVPCHRVVRADGSVGGFRWGPVVKRSLLSHESTSA